MNTRPTNRRDDHASPAPRAQAAAHRDGQGHPEVIACWAAKGGAGTTVVASALALRLAQRSPDGAVLVDTAGDIPAVLGMLEPHELGLAGWLRSEGDDPSPEIPGRPGLSVVLRGVGPLTAGCVDRLAVALARDPRPVAVDCGTVPEGAAAFLAERADQSILVTRPCYLALRRFVSLTRPRPTGVVVVREPGRVLSAADVAGAGGARVVAEVDVDPTVARAIDAGLLARRLPPSLDAGLAVLLGFGRPGSVTRPGHAVANAAEPDPPEVSAW